ncbi:SPRY domain-containing protein 3 [Armadillidium vulgare]|nr:SPRY domain-containing protein 3 [Armadillidium vulgare]
MDILFTDQATLVETLQERQIALEEHANALKERDEAIKTLETDLDDLKRVHEECAEKAMKDTVEIENYINIIEKYEFEMTEKEEKSQKIVKEYEIMTNDISDLNSKLKICQETETFFRDENRRLKLELLESVKKIKALEKDLKLLNLEYSNLKDEHQQMDISVFNSKIKQYQESEALFRDENSRLKMELLDSAGKYEALEKDLKDLRVEYDNLKVKHQPPNGNEQMGELNIKLNILQSENHDLNSEVKNLREQLNEEKNKNKSLDEELDNLDKYYKDCIEHYILTVKGLNEKNKTLSENLKSYKKMNTTNSENVSMDTVVDTKNISNSDEIHNLKSENTKLANLVSKLQEENKSLKSSKKLHTTNYENVSMDTIVDSKNISNSEEIHNLKSESRKLANLVSKLQEENKSLKSSKKMHTTNYENVSMDTIVDSKNISNSEEIHNLKSESRKLANLVSKLQEENELLKKREARKNQEVQTEKDSIDGDEASLREQIFNLKKDNNVLKIQLQAIQAPIKNEAQRWKDELKFEQQKNKKLMSELRRVRNENCDSSMVINNPSNTEAKGLSHGGEQACGFGSGVVLDIQVMRLKNVNYHLEKEKEKMQNEIASLKENVEWYKAKGSEWKTKCYKEEQKVLKLTQKLKTGDEVKNEKQQLLKPTPKLKLEDEPKIKNEVDNTPAEHNQKNVKVNFTTNFFY